MTRNKQTLLDLIWKVEPRLRDAFLEAIEEITSNAEIGRIASFLERGDVEGALGALHIDRAAFRPIERAIAEAFEAGAHFGVGSLPARDVFGGRIVLRADLRNPRAEAWLSSHSATLITNIAEDQRNGIRATLSSAMSEGKNPLRTALDVSGRVEKPSGRRTGGIIGLTAQQASFVNTARDDLLSEDVARMKHYLTLTRRDKRFDRQVQKAIRDGRKLDAETVAKITGRYSDKLLQLRAETIARTESLASIHQGRHEAYLQAIDAGKIRAEDVRRTWRNSGGGRVRDTHIDLHGTSVGIYEPFVTFRGNTLMYPCDPAGPTEETVNCRCTCDYRIDYLPNR